MLCIVSCFSFPQVQSSHIAQICASISFVHFHLLFDMGDGEGAQLHKDISIFLFCADADKCSALVKIDSKSRQGGKFGTGALASWSGHLISTISFLCFTRIAAQHIGFVLVRLRSFSMFHSIAIRALLRSFWGPPALPGFLRFNVVALSFASQSSAFFDSIFLVAPLTSGFVSSFTLLATVH